MFRVVVWFFWDFTGLRYIWRKLLPQKYAETEGRPPSTLFLWLVVIYVVSFGIAYYRYENRIDIIENRAKELITQLSSPYVRSFALSRISTVQNMKCPLKPAILNPASVFKSFFQDNLYTEIVLLLKETVEDWKESLDHVNLNDADLSDARLIQANLQQAQLKSSNLRGAQLQQAFLLEANLQTAVLTHANLSEANLKKSNLLGADLQKATLKGAKLQKATLEKANLQKADLAGAKLKNADLREVDLTDAYNLDIDQLCMAKTLYKAKFSQVFTDEITQSCGHLLEKPDWVSE